MDASQPTRVQAVAYEQALHVRAEIGASPCEDDPAALLSNGGEVTFACPVPSLRAEACDDALPWAGREGGRSGCRAG